MTSNPHRGGPSRATRYVDLRDYAAIGDGRTVALIARDGQVDWMPVPALHSPPVFAALVDGGEGGRFELRPATDDFESTREYVPGTNVLRTTFRTGEGVVTVTDALVTGVAGRLPWLELARRIDGVDGSVRMRWAVVPGNLFDDEHGEVKRIDTVHGPILRAGHIDLAVIGSEHGRSDPHEPGRGDSDGPLSFSGEFVTASGSRHLIALCGTDDEPIHVPQASNVDRGIDRTIANWQAWAEEFDYEGPWQDAVQRSALALKLLIFSPTGSIAAAATTGLPENLTGGKNYDYRFAWVRDLAYTVGALIRFGLREETHAAVSWVLKTLKTHGELHIFFELDGTTHDGVREIDASGWCDIGPVVVGNDAGDQLQLGVYADVLGIMRRYVEAGNILDGRTNQLLIDFTDRACRDWPKKDSGMWELPRKEHYLTSKIGCWKALDDAIHLAELGEVTPGDDDLALWHKNRTLLEEWIAENGWSEARGAYVMHPGSDALDASILLHPRRGFGPQERMDATIALIDDELSAGPLVYRYTGVSDEEGTFVACAFWLVEALARTGHLAEATTRMDALVGLANDVGLFSEMIAGDDAGAGDAEFLGNFPQGLSHLALIDAAASIREQNEA
jgi:GH15 family glucan-1,4-alpha-glucosidase